MNTLYVSFRVGTAEYVLPATEVLHMESYSERGTEVPGTPSWVQGLVQVRGRVVPLLDLRLRFGLPPASDGELQFARIIVVEHSERVVGLLADSAREVLKLDPDGFKNPPEAIRGGTEGFVRSVTIQSNRMLMLLDLPKVLGEVSHDHG